MIAKQTYAWNPNATPDPTWELSAQRKFVWSDWLLLLELDGLNSDAVVRKYTWGLDLAGLNGGQTSGLSAAFLESAGGIGGLLATKNDPGGPATHAALTYDANGNVTQAFKWSTTDPNAALVAHYEYDPYGNRINTPDPSEYDQPFRFSTKMYDPTSELSYFGYRHYSPALGRWIKRDPIGEVDSPNLYLYVAANPISMIDPLGDLLGQGTDHSDPHAGWGWAIGQARLRRAFWHYMFGDGRPWYRDSWAPDVKATDGYKSLFEGLKHTIRSAACGGKNVSLPCGGTREAHFSDAFDAESAANQLSLAPLGRFIIWAEAKCKYRKTATTSIEYRCTARFEVRDPFSFDGFDGDAIMFVTKIANGVPRTFMRICGLFHDGCYEIAVDDMSDAHPFTIYIRWRDVINGVRCCGVSDLEVGDDN